MNRGGIEPPIEGACGGMYRQAAQIKCDEQANVQYICGTKVPAGKNTRHEAHVTGSRNSEVLAEAPEWWMLEVEGYSSNRRNRNRIRKHLRKKLGVLKRRTDISEEGKRAEMRKLESQLDYFQRAPKPAKQSNCRQKKCQGKQQPMPRGKGLESAERVTFRPGRRYGIHGRWVSYPINRVMSRRRYGVSSYRDKFKWLAMKCKM